MIRNPVLYFKSTGCVVVPQNGVNKNNKDNTCV